MEVTQVGGGERRQVGGGTLRRQPLQAWRPAKLRGGPSGFRLGLRGSGGALFELETTQGFGPEDTDLEMK